MKVNFRIEKKHIKDTSSNIRLDFTYNGKRFRKFVGIKVLNQHWNSNKQRIKTSCGDALIVNKRLEILSKKVKDIYFDLLNNNQPISNSILSEKLNESIKGVRNYQSFFEYCEIFLSNSEKTKKPSTVDGYRYSIDSLRKFEKYSKRKIDWDTLDMKFYKEYQAFQYTVLENNPNLFGRRITDIKAIINDATKVGVNKYLDYKKFVIIRTKTKKIYLNDDEVGVLYRLNLTHKKKLERVRDIFIFSCLTGVRFSDYLSINKQCIETLKEGTKIIRYYSKKVDKEIVTVCRDEALLLFKKYNYQFPKISSQNYNLYLKELGQLVGFTENVTIDGYKKGLPIFIIKPKYKFIVSHTARRSFATNLYKKGISITHIMKATGHIKESDFLNYVQHTSEESMIAINRALKSSERIITMNYKRKVS
jgi:integrase